MCLVFSQAPRRRLPHVLASVRPLPRPLGRLNRGAALIARSLLLSTPSTHPGTGCREPPSPIHAPPRVPASLLRQKDDRPSGFGHPRTPASPPGRDDQHASWPLFAIVFIRPPHPVCDHGQRPRKARRPHRRRYVAWWNALSHLPLALLALAPHWLVRLGQDANADSQ